MQASFGPIPSASFSPEQPSQSYSTPLKNGSQETAQKTLKKSILDRLQASKQSSASRQLQRNLNPKPGEPEKAGDKEDESPTAQKELILNNQSQNNPGFYEYSHWLKLHAQSLSFVARKYVEEFWKILRLINYGEVFIPTGLIYQLFMDIKRNNELGGFERIINSFLKENETADSLKTFKDLKSYLSLKEIERAYKCLDEEKKDKGKRVRSQSVSDAFERNYAEAKVRTEKKITKICQALVQESKQLADKPRISVYKSESYQSLVRPERVCKQAHEHRYKDEEEKYLEQNNGVLQNLFKAKQLDKSILEGSIDHIPGVVSHLSRNQYCQAEKLKAQREAMRPQYGKKKLY